MQMKTNKNGVKLLAAAMVLVMAFSAIAVVSSDSSDAATDITYISGKIMDTQEYGQGAIVVQNGNLSIEDGKKLTIKTGASFTIASGYTLTINNGSSLEVQNGALVIVDGTIEVKTGGTIANASIYKNAQVNGTSSGFYVNGTVDVAKGATIAKNSTDGQIILNGTLKTTSSGTTHSVIGNQKISVAQNAVLTLKGDVTKTTVEAFSDSKNPYTYGQVVIDGTGNNSNVNSVVDLKFNTTVEKIDKVFVVSTENKKAQNYILNVSGSLNGSDARSVSMTVKKTVAIALDDHGTNQNVFYPTLAGTGPSDVPVTGIVAVSDSLSVGKNATLSTEANSILNITGKMTADGVKNTTDPTKQASLNFAGILNVSGEMTVGQTTVTTTSTTEGGSTRTTTVTGAVNITMVDSSMILNIEGDGKISLQDYTPASNGVNVNLPRAAHGATIIDSDDVYWFVSLETAISMAVAQDISDIGLWSISYKEGLALAKNYVISEDMTIPEGITLTVSGTIEILKGVTLTIDEDADIEVITSGELAGIDGCLFLVKGTLVDQTLSTSFNYGTTNTSTKIYIDAEVKSIDADETAYTYTTLSNALAGTDSKIVLFGAAKVTGTVTVPEGKVLEVNGKTITVDNDSELIVDGIVDIQTGTITLTAVSGSKAAGKLTNNNIIVTGGTVPTIAGFYAHGDIGDDYKSKNFILAPEVAAANSKTLDSMTVETKTAYSGDLVFTAADNSTQDIVIDIKAEAVFGKITLDGYKITINNDGSTTNGVITATVIAVTTDGESSVKLNKVSTDDLATYVYIDETGDSPVSKFMLDTESSLTGNLTIASGKVYLKGAFTVGSFNTTSKVKSIMTIAEGAEFIVPESQSLIVDSKNLTGTTVSNYAGLVIDGIVSIDKGTISTTATSTPGKILVNGTLDISKNNQTIAGAIDIIGTLNIATEGSDKANMTVSGTMTVGEKPETLGASSKVVGILNVTGKLVVYPGADMSGALINVNDEGVSTAFKVDLIIENEIYMTGYTTSNAAKVNDFIPSSISLPGYEDIKKNTDTTSTWFVDAGFKTKVTDQTVEQYSAAYAKTTVSQACILVSVGSGMSLWIDGVKYTTGDKMMLNVGEYNVEVTINPGYKGTAKITFNGVQVTNGKIVVTPEMSVTAPVITTATPIVLSATGEITIDSGDTPAPVQPTEKDDGMGITDYLLIVLVVLAAILVVIVAIRMMRS